MYSGVAMGGFAFTSGASIRVFSTHTREEVYLGAESTGLDSQQHPYDEGFQKLMFCTETLNLVPAQTTCTEATMPASKTAGIAAF